MNTTWRSLTRRLWLVPLLTCILMAGQVEAEDVLTLSIVGDIVYPGHQLTVPVTYSMVDDTLGYFKALFYLESNATCFWSDATVIDTCYTCLDSMCTNIDTAICTSGTGLIDVSGTALEDWTYVRARKESALLVSVTAFFAWGGPAGTPITPFTHGTLLKLTPMAARDCYLLDTLPQADWLTMMFQPPLGVGELYQRPSFVVITDVGRQFGYAGVYSPMTYMMHGDVNYDGVIDVLDVVGLINYAFRAGDEPCPICAGDMDCIPVPEAPVIDVIDVVLLINYTFRGGAPPQYSDDCTYFY